MRKRLAFLAVAAALLSLMAPAGVAAAHPPEPYYHTLSPYSVQVEPGDTVHFTGWVRHYGTHGSLMTFLSLPPGYPPGSTVSLSPLFSTESNWNYSLDITVPEDATPGDYTIRVTALFYNVNWVCNSSGCHSESWAVNKTAYATLQVKGPNEAPDVSNAAPTVSSIWPPNHKFVDVGINGVTDPDGDPVTIVITGILQDEPVHGEGSGETGPDGQGVGTSTARVRAERDGAGNGRVYTIRFTAYDGNGGASSGEVTVSVPHDQDSEAVNDGALYNSTAP